MPTIPRTDAGWPYLTGDHPVSDVAAYSAELAAGLAGMAPTPGTGVTDTGWLILEAMSGWQLSGMAGRRVGELVFLRGSLRVISGGNPVNTPNMFTLPAELRPSGIGPLVRLSPIISANGGIIGSVSISATTGVATCEADYLTGPTPTSYARVNQMFLR